MRMPWRASPRATQFQYVTGNRPCTHSSAASIRFEGTNVQIHVMDLSPGLPASEMARAMLPFVRLDRVRGGACGAVPGLSSANKIAFCHDGQLLNS